MTGTVALEHIDQGAGHPLVLLMGLGAGADAWKPHMDAWSDRFRCIAIHNRGVAPSPSPHGPYSTADMADDVAELMGRLRLERATVVGISMGGTIAQKLALRHHHLVEALVLTASWAQTTPYTHAVFDTLVDARRDLSEPAFTRLLQTIIWSPAGFDARTNELDAALRTPPSVTADAFAAQAAACTSHDTVARLGEITVPTLITAGDQDRFVPLHDSLRLKGIPHADVEVFHGAGHVHHWEHLERYNTLVERWITTKATP